MGDRGGAPNVKELFHGTSSTDPMLIVKGAVGLDIRRSSGIYYGKGIYTATNFDYSHKYKYQAGSQEATMVICDVLCGNVKDYNNVTQGSAMSCAPNLPAPNDAYEYDSVTGTHDNTTMYAVYDNGHVYAK